MRLRVVSALSKGNSSRNDLKVLSGILSTKKGIENTSTNKLCNIKGRCSSFGVDAALLDDDDGDDPLPLNRPNMDVVGGAAGRHFVMLDRV